MRMGTFSAFVRLSVTMRQLAEVNWSALFSKVKGAGLQPRGGGAPETFLAEQTKNQPGIVQRLFFKALGARFLGMPSSPCSSHAWPSGLLRSPPA